MIWWRKIWLLINIMFGRIKSSLQIYFEGTLIGHIKFKFSIMVDVSTIWGLLFPFFIFCQFCVFALDWLCSYDLSDRVDWWYRLISLALLSMNIDGHLRSNPDWSILWIKFGISVGSVDGFGPKHFGNFFQLFYMGRLVGNIGILVSLLITLNEEGGTWVLRDPSLMHYFSWELWLFCCFKEWFRAESTFIFNKISNIRLKFSQQILLLFRQLLRHFNQESHHLHYPNHTWSPLLFE